MCIKKISLEFYTRYYNHTLEMAIMKKVERNRRFKEADIFYVFRALLDIWKHISEELNGKYVELFNLKNVYLSPEGFVKMYPFPIEIDFVSSPLKPRRKKGLGSILESEEVQVEVSPKKVQRSASINSPYKIVRQLSDKDSLKDIGIILYQLVFLNK